jgi:ABC-type branched-subunit amino acid transport system ATPase component
MTPSARRGPGLAVSEVVVRFGGVLAVDHVSLEVRPKRIAGLIGPNGAGKTTVFNVCSGYQAADAGSVHLGGVDITRASPARRARRGLGRTFQRMELFTSMTVRESVAFAAECRRLGDSPWRQLGIRVGRRHAGRDETEAVEQILAETGLTDVADKTTNELSTAHGRLTELARALARQPAILLLDEPSSGLDTKETAEFGMLLQRLVDERDLGILLVEHDMSLVLSVCEQIQVLDSGRSLMSGTPAEVRASPAVRAAYLG